MKMGAIDKNMAMVLKLIRAGLIDGEMRASQQSCNLPPEEVAERDRPKSRQERRALERAALKQRRKQK